MVTQVHEQGRHQMQLRTLLGRLQPSVVLISRNAQDSLVLALD